MKYNVDNVVIMSERPFQFTALFCFLLSLAVVVRVVVDRFFFFSIKLLASVSNELLLNAILISLLIIVAVLSFTGELTIRSFLILRGFPQYVVRDDLEEGLFVPCLRQ